MSRPRTPSLQRRLAIGTALLVVATTVAFLAYAILAARGFYFRIRAETLEASVHAIEAVVVAAPDGERAAAALDRLVSGDVLVGATAARVSLDGETLLRRRLDGSDLERIERDIPASDLVAPGTTGLQREVTLASGDHEVARRIVETPRGRLDIVLADPDADTLARRRREIVLGLTAVGGVTAIGVVAAWMIVAMGLRPIHRLRDTLDEIGDRPPPSLPSSFGAAPRELQPMVDALDRLLERLDRAFERERRFTADAAHELRTPLAGLRTSVDLARSRSRHPESDARALDDMDESTRRLESISRELLELARAGSPGPTGTEACDLTEAAREACSDLIAEAERRGIEFLFSSGTASTPRARIPKDWAIRITANLVANAVRHGPRDGRVTITTATSAATQAGTPDPMVMLSVHDRGRSLSSPDLGRIFDRFTRLDRHGADDRGGTGLGLAIAREAVEAFGGTIEAQVTADGTRFVVRLPAATE